MSRLSAFIRLHMHFFGSQAFIALGASWLLVDVVLVTLLGSEPTRNQGLGIFISLCLLALVFAATRLFSEISSVSFRIRNTRVTLNIVFGDVFNQGDGAIVIPVNRYFDHELQSGNVGAPVAPTSVHGQAIRNWNTPSEFRESVDFDLNRVERGLRFEQNANRAILPQKMYDLGTVATVKRPNSTSPTALFHFLAMAEVKDSNFQAHSDLPALVTALASGWRQIFERYATTPLAVPLIGSGFGKVGLEEEHLLDVMIATIAEFHAAEKMPSNVITIVLTDTLKGKIKLYNVKREWS